MLPNGCIHGDGEENHVICVCELPVGCGYPCSAIREFRSNELQFRYKCSASFHHQLKHFIYTNPSNTQIFSIVLSFGTVQK